MSTELLIAAVGLAGVLIGSLLTQLFEGRREKSKHFQEIRSSAYADFIKSMGEITQGQRHGDAERERAGMALMTAAKTRIAIYGSASVTTALAGFFRDYGALTSDDAFNSMIRVVSAMRRDTPDSKDVVSERDIRSLLFGS